MDATFEQCIHMGCNEIFRTQRIQIEGALIIGVDDDHIGCRQHVGLKAAKTEGKAADYTKKGLHHG